MPTRKLAARPAPVSLFAASLTIAILFISGCATPGPLHLYTTAPAEPAVVRDLDDRGAPVIDVPSYLEPEDQLTGLAYDPFTDHLFLRLAPGNHVRVVDRPARKIKRDYTAAGVPAEGGGDLAVRPADGYVYFTHPTRPALVVTNRFGEFIRDLPLSTLAAPPVGVAFDTVANHLLVLTDATHVSMHTLDGAHVANLTLDHAVAPHALAFDSAAREFYAPLADAPAIGVFAENGRLLRQLPATAPAGALQFLDAGPRSFVRMF